VGNEGQLGLGSEIVKSNYLQKVNFPKSIRKGKQIQMNAHRASFVPGNFSLQDLSQSNCNIQETSEESLVFEDDKVVRVEASALLSTAITSNNSSVHNKCIIMIK
jgi:hypothetical protein